MQEQAETGAKPKPYRLGDNTSILLDIVRFSAAIAVVISHVGEDAFNTGWMDRKLLGDIAVPVFFVLSGFVIRFVTLSREGNPREYYIDRASRIYSVVFPAIVLTILCALLCFLLDRQRFFMDRTAIFAHPLAGVLANLIFLSQIWSHNVIPHINAPFWSLSYECPYYLLYGLVFFLRGWKRIITISALAVLLGPQVLFLFPLWWAGVWLFDAYHWLRNKRVGTHAAVALTFWAGGSVVWRSFSAKSLPPTIQWVFTQITSLPQPLEMLGFPARHATVLAYAAGLISAVLLLLALLAVDGCRLSLSPRAKSTVRWIAEGTFAIYLFHYPLLYVCAYARLFRHGDTIRNLTVVLAVVIVCILSAKPLDVLKLKMRQWLRAAFPA